MKKFCPNCGNPVEKDDKFCIRCGQSLDNSTELLKKENPVKPSKKFKLVYWLISGIVLLIIAFGCAYYHSYQSKQQTLKEISKMSQHKLAGLTIVYAHSHYDNLAWERTYDEALKGIMDVQRYKKYNLHGATIMAKGNNYVYVINNQVVFTTNKKLTNKQSELVLSDGKKIVGRVNTLNAYQEVRQHKYAELQKIDRRKDMYRLPLRTAAIMAALSHDSEKNIQEEINFNYKHHEKMLFNDENGEYRLQLGADAVSGTRFKYSGEDLIIKYIKPQDKGAACDWPTKTIRVESEDLVDEYYQTVDQKKFVNSLANKIILDKSVNR